MKTSRTYGVDKTHLQLTGDALTGYTISDPLTIEEELIDVIEYGGSETEPGHHKEWMYHLHGVYEGRCMTEDEVISLLTYFKELADEESEECLSC